ncbi:hypothetical protein V8E51_019512 [Hyaloscypha variabilis]|jgi:hypothetical protein|uniref:Uncharacterized protein n=1 Tax=Hyaloscypha variabilis (strain UAMH 11265 / GT02V1 / F) TaxID=1149755 RepID=A0A2J6QR53_HYAVF|nr:hypothetical protein L207DRAFT_521417 [Hyaloscypha variabilis F]
MQWKVSSIVAISFLASQVACIAVADPEADAGPSKMVARDCDFSDPCTAALGTPEGVYCGYCSEVETFAYGWDVYNLYPDGSCCNYGYRQSCADSDFDPNQCPISS